MLLPRWDSLDNASEDRIVGGIKRDFLVIFWGNFTHYLLPVYPAGIGTLTSGLLQQRIFVFVGFQISSLTQDENTF